MVSIGNNVRVAFGVKFITHDIFSQMLNSHPKYSELGKFYVHFGEIKVGDNVCIGGGVLIMPGVIIESNTIIAGGSVVTKDVPSGYVVGGNPAKVIGTVDNLVNKRCENKDIENWDSKRIDLEMFYCH